jgi:hypothetical protein
VEEATVSVCWFRPCVDPVVFEAIGSYDEVVRSGDTVVMTLCRRHAEVVGDLAVVLEAP